MEQALTRVESAEMLEVLAHSRHAWLAPMFADQVRTTPSRATKLVDPAALANLAGVSAFLTRVASEGAVPDQDAQDGIRSAIASALEEVLADETLTVEAKQLLHDQLHRLLWALDHLRIVGPDGVVGAAERLSAAMDTRLPKEQLQRPTSAKVRQVALTAWQLFVAIPKVHIALENFRGFLDAIGPGDTP